MATFTAEQFNKNPAKVYRCADKNGEVKINHDRYDDKVFILVSRDRQSLITDEEDEIMINGKKYAIVDL